MCTFHEFAPVQQQKNVEPCLDYDEKVKEDSEGSLEGCASGSNYGNPCEVTFFVPVIPSCSVLFSFPCWSRIFQISACQRTNLSLLQQARLLDGMQVFVQKPAVYVPPLPSCVFHAMDKDAPFCLVVYLVAQRRCSLCRRKAHSPTFLEIDIILGVLCITVMIIIDRLVLAFCPKPAWHAV